MGETIVISKRLKALADMVTVGNSVADVGCDHGFLSIYLCQQNISLKLLAMDLREGPLSGAKSHIKEYGLDESITTRLSDGLKAYEIGEADTLVCAGMGGPLMQKILYESFDKTCSFKELILQPQSEIGDFRKSLRERDIKIIDENMVFEEGKYYFLMKCIPNSKIISDAQSPKELYDLYGYYLLKKRNPILKDYLTERKSKVIQILAGLEENMSDRGVASKDRLNKELKQICEALDMFL